MPELITLKDIEITVERKNIKNMYLKVHPPAGDIHISAPQRINSETIRLFAISKLPWIRKQRQKIQSQQRESPRQYLTRESHYLWGDRYLLEVIEVNQAPKVILQHNTIQLQVRPNTNTEQRGEILSQWYRQQLKAAIPPLIQKWEPVMNVKVNKFFCPENEDQVG